MWNRMWTISFSLFYSHSLSSKCSAHMKISWFFRPLHGLNFASNLYWGEFEICPQFGIEFAISMEIRCEIQSLQRLRKLEIVIWVANLFEIKRVFHEKIELEIDWSWWNSKISPGLIPSVHQGYLVVLRMAGTLDSYDFTTPALNSPKWPQNSTKSNLFSIGFTFQWNVVQSQIYFLFLNSFLCVSNLTKFQTNLTGKIKVERKTNPFPIATKSECKF